MPSDWAYILKWSGLPAFCVNYWFFTNFKAIEHLFYKSKCIKARNFLSISSHYYLNIQFGGIASEFVILYFSYSFHLIKGNFKFSGTVRLRPRRGGRPSQIYLFIIWINGQLLIFYLQIPWIWPILTTMNSNLTGLRMGSWLLFFNSMIYIWKTWPIL